MQYAHVTLEQTRPHADKSNIKEVNDSLLEQQKQQEQQEAGINRILFLLLSVRGMKS